MSEPITVDIWSDVACPWCYIGKRRFERGAQQAERAGGPPVQVTYHSFELSPDTPVDFAGSEEDFLAQHKGMAPEQVRQMLAHVGSLAAEEGLRYDFDALLHANTLKAHQVLHLAKAHGKQQALAERLFAGYFEQGRNLGSDEELADLAADVGLDHAEVLVALREGRYADAVAADIAQARAYGISGVPFYVIEGRYGVSGAQDPETFAGVLGKVAGERGSGPGDGEEAKSAGR